MPSNRVSKSMISRPAAVEYADMVGSFAYPAPSKQSLPPKAARKIQLPSFLWARHARKLNSQGTVEIATRPLLAPICAVSKPKEREMVCQLTAAKEAQWLATGGNGALVNFSFKHEWCTLKKSKSRGRTHKNKNNHQDHMDRKDEWQKAGPFLSSPTCNSRSFRSSNYQGWDTQDQRKKRRQPPRNNQHRFFDFGKEHVSWAESSLRLMYLKILYSGQGASKIRKAKRIAYVEDGFQARPRLHSVLQLRCVIGCLSEYIYVNKILGGGVHKNNEGQISNSTQSTSGITGIVLQGIWGLSDP
ncbi:hypothetical protein FIBSPDRAFT_993932 [Athelia psychrophila]|uniref:Uncharacterized protein n=1 Tax=Athelia psychrophila TaxID=1759441 RepID=A0A165Y482_9AGAM|nr:hypothetical protein FIBSPDRAFT_993932 [Fibularhizoctonia sp. CBS 109695]